MLVHTYATGGGNVSCSSQSIEFTTTFNNGMVVDTNNSKDFGAFPVPSTKVMYSLFWEQDVEKIFQFHNAICQDVRMNSIPVNKLDEQYDGDGLAWVREGIQEENEQNAAIGFLKPTEDEFLLTLSGAYSITWKQLFPFKQMRYKQMKQKVRRVMSNLDIRLD